MADASRFPQLALPFAIVGAAAGWLSTGLLASPLVHLTHPGKQDLAAACALVFAAGTGALLTRWCVGPRYAYEIEVFTPDLRPRTDTWPRHFAAVLAAGILSGAAVAVLCDAYGGPLAGAGAGLVSAVAFLPVCAAVIAAARRAQRARLGSIVAGSDHRAVWGILAAALALTTLMALPDWSSAALEDTFTPWPALFMVLAAGAVTVAILLADLRALRRARRAIAPGLEQRDPAGLDPVDASVPSIDLGLGADVLGRFARGASAYRGRDRAIALVQGSPEQAVAALRRAALRGALALVGIGAVCGAHAAAATKPARALYQEIRCDEDPEGCVPWWREVEYGGDGRAASALLGGEP